MYAKHGAADLHPTDLGSQNHWLDQLHLIKAVFSGKPASATASRVIAVSLTADSTGATLGKCVRSVVPEPPGDWLYSVHLRTEKLSVLTRWKGKQDYNCFPKWHGYTLPPGMIWCGCCIYHLENSSQQLRVNIRDEFLKGKQQQQQKHPTLETFLPAWLLAYSKYQTLLLYCHLVKLYNLTKLCVYLYQTIF